MLQRLIRLLRGTEPSSKTAKSRLKLILVQDRLGIDEEVMKELQVEITQVLSRHFTLGEQVEIDLQREEQAMALVAYNPKTGMKDRKKSVLTVPELAHQTFWRPHSCRFKLDTTTIQHVFVNNAIR